MSGLPPSNSSRSTDGPETKLLIQPRMSWMVVASVTSKLAAICWNDGPVSVSMSNSDHSGPPPVPGPMSTMAWACVAQTASSAAAARA